MIPEKDLIIKLIEVLHPSIKIYLFGSRARGTHSRTSDIDLALDNGQKLSLKEIARVRNIIEALSMPRMIDIVDIHTVPSALKEIIAKEGIEWKLVKD